MNVLQRTRLYAVEVPIEMPETMRQTLLERCSPERRRRIAAFVREDDQLRSMLGEALIRYAAGKQTDIRGNRLSFAYGPHGKPYILQAPEWAFNLSHAGRWAAVIASVESAEAGIDVEQIAPIGPEVAEACFSVPERQYLRAQSESERLACFYRLWTLKESYVKAIGRGLSLPLASFSVVPSGAGMATASQNAASGGQDAATGGNGAVSNSANTDGKSSTSASEYAAAGDKGAVSGSKGAVAGVEGAVSGTKGVVAGDKGVVSGSKGVVAGDKGAVSGSKGAVAGVEGAVSGTKGVVACPYGAVAGGAGFWRCPEAPQFRFVSFPLDDEHLLAACISAGSLPEWAERLTLEQLLADSE